MRRWRDHEGRERDGLPNGLVKVEVQNSNESGTTVPVKMVVWPGELDNIDQEEQKRVKARRCQLRVVVKHMKGLESNCGEKSNFTEEDFKKNTSGKACKRKQLFFYPSCAKSLGDKSMMIILGNLSLHCPGGLFKGTTKRSWSITTILFQHPHRASRYNRKLFPKTWRERKQGCSQRRNSEKSMK